MEQNLEEGIDDQDIDPLQSKSQKTQKQQKQIDKMKTITKPYPKLSLEQLEKLRVKELKKQFLNYNQNLVQIIPIQDQQRIIQIIPENQNQQMATTNNYSKNALETILKQIQSGRGDKYQKAIEGKFQVNEYGMRVMDPTYMSQLQKKRNDKANQGSYDAFRDLFSAVPNIQESSEAMTQLGIFNGLKTNAFGQWLKNGQLTTFKKITSKLSEIQKRSPIILLMKRVVQLNRAKAMVQSYIAKNKSIAASEKKAIDPAQIALRQYNSIKSHYKKILKNPDPDAKMITQIQLIRAKRERLFTIDQTVLQNTLAETFEKQQLISSYYKAIGAASQKKIKLNKVPDVVVVGKTPEKMNIETQSNTSDNTQPQ